ncbi:CDP-glucose 4,6-dehydratase [Ramlibacter montanisoli]|uniref:CDP-glucose 4,6-dehydratase n=1 Tax=Ramlibacter montanisoli TaxID=2732512 RepID=A0A849KPD3_9BURK|nr:CDP-glucose 4,6-dehydratase [Ramlibacter montanisoli]NNU43659.1 CDP-glucose 4,6-dehydratase [Ramlibacter montanisoli]
MSGRNRPDPSFWRGKQVLLTGHTGFKGAWLAIWLHRLGARVTGIGLEPATQPSLFSLAQVAQLCSSQICDIRDPSALAARVRPAEPQIVLHLAAQPLVREGYARPVDTFATNVMGTAHLLEALRGMSGVRVALVITTDKVYRNLEQPYPYREDDALGGHDPYSASKAACEIVTASYRDAFLRAQGVTVATARAGNVIGGGDWSADRLLPDAVKAWASGTPLQIRRPDAIRPWQHVLEPLAGYLALAERAWSDPGVCGGWNFGPLTHEAATVKTVVELARGEWPGAQVHYGDGSEGPHEAGWLALEIAKARSALGFRPRWSLAEGVRRTMAWYLQQRDGAAARALCEAEIAAWEEAE